MPDSTSQARPPLEFIPPKLNPLVLGATQQLLPFWLQSQTPITQIKAENVELLVDLYRQFQQGKVRFLMAFRHPTVYDPFCMTHLLWRLVPKVAKQKGVSLDYPIHAHFIYDRGIPLWAGSSVGWLYSRLGGTPIHRGKADWTGLRSARNLFANGKLPMAASPEGATNGHSEVISSLEPGISQLGFWCVEDLLKAGRNEQVLIVPVGIQYSYVDAPWQSIEHLLTELEEASGLTVDKKSEMTDFNQLPDWAFGSGYTEHYLEVSLYQRLYHLGEHLLSLMEDFYSRFYHKKLPSSGSKEKYQQHQSLTYKNEELRARLQNLLNVALEVAEEYFNLPAKGGVIDRCRRLEQAGWNYIFREELKDEQEFSAVERGLANRLAEEANLRMWHMRIVESFVSVTGKYVLEKPTAERFAETTLLLWDTVTRIKGGNSFARPQLGKQEVKLTVGQPISVSERYAVYQESRHSARQAVADLTQDLQKDMEGLILPGFRHSDT